MRLRDRDRLAIPPINHNTSDATGHVGIHGSMPVQFHCTGVGFPEEVSLRDASTQ